MQTAPDSSRVRGPFDRGLLRAGRWTYRGGRLVGIFLSLSLRTLGSLMRGVLIGTSAPIMLAAVGEDSSILLSFPLGTLASLVSRVFVGLEGTSRASARARRWRLRGRQRPGR